MKNLITEQLHKEQKELIELTKMIKAGLDYGWHDSVLLLTKELQKRTEKFVESSKKQKGVIQIANS